MAGVSRQEFLQLHRRVREIRADLERRGTSMDMAILDSQMRTERVKNELLTRLAPLSAMMATGTRQRETMEASLTTLTNSLETVKATVANVQEEVAQQTRDLKELGTRCDYIVRDAAAAQVRHQDHQRAVTERFAQQSELIERLADRLSIVESRASVQAPAAAATLSAEEMAKVDKKVEKRMRALEERITTGCNQATLDATEYTEKVREQLAARMEEANGATAARVAQLETQLKEEPLAETVSWMAGRLESMEAELQERAKRQEEQEEVTLSYGMGEAVGESRDRASSQKYPPSEREEESVWQRTKPKRKTEPEIQAESEMEAEMETEEAAEVPRRARAPPAFEAHRMAAPGYPPYGYGYGYAPPPYYAPPPVPAPAPARVVAPIRLPPPTKFLPENKKELPSEWIEQLTTHFDALGLAENERVAIALPLLGGSAAAWVTATPFQRQYLAALTWTEFKERFIERFEPIDREMHYRDQLAKVKFNQGQDLVDYCQKFRNLRARCQDMGEPEAYRIFEASLTRELLWELRIRPDVRNDFEAAVAFIQGLGGVAAQMPGKYYGGSRGRGGGGGNRGGGRAGGNSGRHSGGGRGTAKEALATVETSPPEGRGGGRGRGTHRGGGAGGRGSGRAPGGRGEPPSSGKN